MVSPSYVVRWLLMCGLALWAPAHAHPMATARAESPPERSVPPGWLAPAPEPRWDLAKSEKRRTSFGGQVGAVKWEVAAIAAWITAIQIGPFLKEHRSFHFKDEGWFGKSTANLGVDKLTHAYNAYLVTELLQARIARKSDAPDGGALTAAILAAGLMAYGELYDAHKVDGGFSKEDFISNLAGAGFSVLRNTIPGMREKVDFRLLVIPNSDIITFRGKRHFAQQRFLLALQLAGFDGLEDSPLRFVELHAGYYAKNFTLRERAAGEIPRRKPFIGIGLNLQQLFFRKPRSTAGRVANTALDYIQVPYTAVHVD